MTAACDLLLPVILSRADGEGSSNALLMAFEDPSPSSRLRMTNCVATAASAVGGRSGRRYTGGVKTVGPEVRATSVHQACPYALPDHFHQLVRVERLADGGEGG